MTREEGVPAAPLRMTMTVVLALVALLLALPGAAWAGTVSLGIAAANDVQRAEPGEEASVSLGMAVGLDPLPAPGEPGSSVTLGIAVGYDRTAQDSYTVKLDANNGSRADAFRGSVSRARLSVPADAEYDEAFDEGTPDSYDKGKPAGVAADVLADVSAARPGYAFDGWYWAMTDDKGKPVADPADYGRFKLGEGPVGLSSFEDYDYVRAHAEMTLVAKWALAPYVTIDLEGARTEDGYAKLWCWPGRGYALARPSADMEVTRPQLLAGEGGIPEGGLDVTVELGVAANPAHRLSTKIFTGWGYEVQRDGRLERVELVGCQKDGGAFRYLLTPRALDYAGGDIASWNALSSPEEDPAAPAGSRRAMWEALYDTAHISVAAPFRVTFQKEVEVDGGVEARPYTADELEGRLGALPQIYSPGQAFYNRSTAGEGDDRLPVSVYVSAIECVDKGAGSLFPCTGDDRRVLGLGETETFIGGAGAGTAVRFGYDPFLGQNRAVAGADSETWIVLPPAETEGEGETAALKPSRTLFFGLDLTKVRLERGAIAMGGAGPSAASSSYVETLANVKYTYSVVP